MQEKYFSRKIETQWLFKQDNNATIAEIYQNEVLPIIDSLLNEFQLIPFKNDNINQGLTSFLAAWDDRSTLTRTQAKQLLSLLVDILGNCSEEQALISKTNFILGILHEYGMGNQQNIFLAEEFYSNATKNDECYGPAFDCLGFINEQAGFLNADFALLKKAIHYYQKASNIPTHYGFYNLARFYFELIKFVLTSPQESLVKENILKEYSITDLYSHAVNYCIRAHEAAKKNNDLQLLQEVEKLTKQIEQQNHQAKGAILTANHTASRLKEVNPNAPERLKQLSEQYVIIRVWKTRSQEQITSSFSTVTHMGERGFNFGHVSLEIVKKNVRRYISHWPGDRSTSPFEGVVAQQKRSFEEDIYSEGSKIIAKDGKRRAIMRMPDCYIVLYTLDIEKMLQRYEEIKKSNFALLAQLIPGDNYNCSTLSNTILKAGNLYQLFKINEPFFMNPNAMADLAIAAKLYETTNHSWTIQAQQQQQQLFIDDLLLTQKNGWMWLQLILQNNLDYSGLLSDTGIPKIPINFQLIMEGVVNHASTKLLEYIQNNIVTIAMVKTLLKQGALLNCVDENRGLNALQWAVIHNRKEIAEILLWCFPDTIRCVTPEGKTLENLASKHDQLTTMLRTFNEKEETLYRPSFLTEYDTHLTNIRATNINDSLLPLEFENKFVETEGSANFNTLVSLSKSSDINEAIIFLKTENINVRARDKFGETPLHISCRLMGNLDLKNLSADEILKYEKSLVEIIQFQLEIGADIHAKTDEGKTPLHFAIEFSRSEKIIKCLLQHKDAYVQLTTIDNKGQTVLHFAVARQGKTYTLTEAIVKLLNKYKANEILNRADYYLQPPIYFLLPKKFNKADEQTKTFMFLLNKKVNVDFKDIELLSPLHLAVKLGDLKIIEAVLIAAKEKNPRDFNGDVPLHWALQYNCGLEVIILLIKYGANPDILNYNLLSPRAIAATKSEEIHKYFNTIPPKNNPQPDDASSRTFLIDHLVKEQRFFFLTSQINNYPELMLKYGKIFSPIYGDFDSFNPPARTTCIDDINLISKYLANVTHLKHQLIIKQEKQLQNNSHLRDATFDKKLEKFNLIIELLQQLRWRAESAGQIIYLANRYMAFYLHNKEALTKETNKTYKEKFPGNSYVGILNTLERNAPTTAISNVPTTVTMENINSVNNTPTVTNNLATEEFSPQEIEEEMKISYNSP